MSETKRVIGIRAQKRIGGNSQPIRLSRVSRIVRADSVLVGVETPVVDALFHQCNVNSKPTGRPRLHPSHLPLGSVDVGSTQVILGTRIVRIRAIQRKRPNPAYGCHHSTRHTAVELALSP